MPASPGSSFLSSPTGSTHFPRLGQGALLERHRVHPAASPRHLAFDVERLRQIQAAQVGCDRGRPPRRLRCAGAAAVSPSPRSPQDQRVADWPEGLPSNRPRFQPVPATRLLASGRKVVPERQFGGRPSDRARLSVRRAPALATGYVAIGAVFTLVVSAGLPVLITTIRATCSGCRLRSVRASACLRLGQWWNEEAAPTRTRSSVAAAQASPNDTAWLATTRPSGSHLRFTSPRRAQNVRRKDRVDVAGPR